MVEHSDQQEKKAREAGHWAYQGDTGPRNCGSLHADFAQCGIRQSQSPIDITSWQTDTSLPPLDFRYKPAVLRMSNNGYTVVSRFDGKAGCVEVKGERYKLLQFHFHTSSEHNVQGKAYPMEIHLVHQNKQGKLLVVGVLVRHGHSHPALETLFQQLPNRVGTQGPAMNFDVNDLLPAARGYFHYQGSLTTPPFSQGVQWYVLSEPVIASRSQGETVFQSLGGKPNNRSVQPLNSRTVWRRVS